MHRVLEWLGRHGAILASFAGGVLIGALLRYPTGWVLPDSSANIIGAAAGAMLSVGGAFVVMRNQQAVAIRERQAAQTEAFKHYADVLVDYLLSVQQFLTEYPGIGYDDVYSYTERLKRELSFGQERVNAFDAYRFELGLEGTRALNTTRSEFISMWTCVNMISNTATHAAQMEDARIECYRQYVALTKHHNGIVEEIAKVSMDDGYLELLAPEPVDY